MSLCVETLEVGMLAVNCHLVWCENGRDALVIDPGDDAADIAAAVAERDLEPIGILLTHAHVDHIRGVPDLVRRFGIPAYVHPADRPLYDSPENALPPWVPAAEGLPVPAGEPPTLAGKPFSVLDTPGHTPGGVCYLFPEDGIVFAGDTLFQGSVGRTDLPGGNAERLLQSIREQLLTLPAATRVYPGHGPPTTIGSEQRSNPFF